MKQIIIFLLTLLGGISSVQAQLLWKVEGNGLERPSYVLGTFHMAKAGFTDSIRGLNAALENCDQVYGEVNALDEKPDTAFIKKMMGEKYLPEGTTLDSLLTPEEMTRVNECFKTLLNLDLTNPMYAAVKKLKPSVLCNLLTAKLYSEAEPNMQTEPFDKQLQVYAREHGKEIGGFETMAFQVELLHKMSPVKRQVEILVGTVDHLEEGRDMIKDMFRIYYAQDLEALGKLYEAQQNTPFGFTTEQTEIMIYKRNADWVDKMPALMQKGSTLVTVGCAHLPGERGLLQLLKNKGYSVTPVE